MLKKYLALLRRSVAAMVEYRASALIWMLTNIMPLVMLAAWYSLSEGGPIADYSQNDFVSYYLLLAFVRQATNAWVIWELDYEIRHGDLSVKLLFPIHPIHDYISTHIADKILRAPILLILGLAAWAIFPTIHYDATWLNLALMIFAMVIGWLIIFLTQFCLGLLAFWISEASTLNEIWYAAAMMLGGVIAPLDLFPAPIRAVADYLPFRFTISFPVEILSGRLSPQQLVTGLVTMLGWFVVMLALYRWLWRKGLRQFSAYGA